MKIIDKLPKNKKNYQLAKNLRNNATKEEKHLWYDFIKGYKIKFHLQIIIGDYIVDFFSPKSKLVIEIDGSQHYAPMGIERDRIRTNYLNSLDIKILRFTNIDINSNFISVCQTIEEESLNRMQK